MKLPKLPKLLGGVTGAQSVAAWAIAAGGVYYLQRHYYRAPAAQPYTEAERDANNAAVKARAEAAAAAAVHKQ